MIAIRKIRSFNLKLLSVLFCVIVAALLFSPTITFAQKINPPTSGKSSLKLNKAYKKQALATDDLARTITNPSGNLAPNPNFNNVCQYWTFTNYDNSDGCQLAALQAIDNAQRVDDGIGPMPLNLANFERLTAAQQVFVTTNLERQQRGLPPIDGMTDQLNALAAQAAPKHQDPTIGDLTTLSGGLVWDRATGNESRYSYNALAADYEWMYDDGCPGANLDCNGAHPSPWGHRENILENYNAGYCTNGAIYMGAALGPEQTLTALTVGTCSAGRPTDVNFTWQQAQILLACSPVNGGSTLGANQLLCPNQSLVSPNGQYHLAIQSTGNLALTNASGQAAWSVGPTGVTPGYLIMRADGNLVLNNAAGNAEWLSNTVGTGGAQLVVQNDGNVVMVNAAGTAVWSSQGGLVKDPPILYSGQRLYTGQYLDSPSGNYQLILQPDGNLVEYGPGGNPLWQSHTQGAAAAYVQLMSNGNLMMDSSNGTLLWQSRTFGIAPGGWLQLQDDSNLVLYATSGTVVWSLDTGFLNGATLAYPQSLNTGSCLVSDTTGRYRLCMQPDNNLVLYNTQGSAVWQANSYGSGASYLIMQPDGNLVLYTAAGQPVWYTNTEGRGGTHLTMQPDGNLVMYNNANQAIWWSGTEGR